MLRKVINHLLNENQSRWKIQNLEYVVAVVLMILEFPSYLMKCAFEYLRQCMIFQERNFYGISAGVLKSLNERYSEFHFCENPIFT